MAKKNRDLSSFDVYEQEDGALVVLAAGDEPEYEIDPVWSGEAEDERDAIRQTRKSDVAYKTAPAANPDHEPNTPNDARQAAEDATNRRLGITRPSKTKKAGTKKRTTTGAKKSAAKRAVKKAKPARKTARRK